MNGGMSPDEGYSHSFDPTLSDGSIPSVIPDCTHPSTLSLSRPTSRKTLVPKSTSSPQKKRVVPRNGDGPYSPRGAVEISPENLETTIEELRLELEGMKQKVDQRAASRASKSSKSHHIHRPVSYAKKTLEEYDRLLGLYEQHVQSHRANLVESFFSIADSTLCASNSSPERLSSGGSRGVEFPRSSPIYQSPPARRHRYVQRESRKAAHVRIRTSSSSSREEEREEERTIRLSPIRLPPRKDYSEERRRSAMSNRPSTTEESRPENDFRKRNQKRIALVLRNHANKNPPKNPVTTASTRDPFAPVQDVDKISKKRHSAFDCHRMLSGSSVRNLMTNPVRERVVQRTNSLGRNRKPTRNAFVSSSNPDSISYSLLANRQTVLNQVKVLFPSCLPLVVSVLDETGNNDDVVERLVNRLDRHLRHLEEILEEKLNEFDRGTEDDKKDLTSVIDKFDSNLEETRTFLENVRTLQRKDIEGTSVVNQLKAIHALLARCT